MRPIFNVSDWLPEGEESKLKVPATQRPVDRTSVNSKEAVTTAIERVTSRIEASRIDLTSSYRDWLQIGFALCDELGEGGRDYFHRLSRFYPGYSAPLCDKQYDHCLKARGHGITIKSFFHLAKQGGVELGTGRREKEGRRKEEEKAEEKVEGVNEKPEEIEEQPESFAPSSLPFAPSPLPTLPVSVYAGLPDLLQKVVAVAESEEERDILFLGSLTALSACFPKVYGIYDGKRVYSNLYLFVTAQASAGKGRLVQCKQLVMPVHNDLRTHSCQLKLQYDKTMREYNAVKGLDSSTEKPQKPPEKLLIIPANSSATGFFQLLADNDGSGLIFETEGDTMALAFKADYSNYSDGTRKASHHEMISYYRRTDRELVEILCPRLSMVLSGTPKQVISLIPSAENGLFSRFIFYHMNIHPFWKDVFATHTEHGLEAYFDQLGLEFYELFKALRQNPAIEFSLNSKQQLEFNAFFTQVQEKYLGLLGMDYMATIRRLGLIAFRLAMVLTSLRMMETGDLSAQQVCSDEDFERVLSMIRILVRHSGHVYSELPEEVRSARPKDRKEQFLEQLPERFTSQEFADLANGLSLSRRTAERYMADFCEKCLISRDQLGCYVKRGGEGEKMRG